MINREELDVHIARLEYEESSYTNYAKLADLYSIRDHLDGPAQKMAAPQEPESYTFASEKIKVSPTTDFLGAVDGKQIEDVLRIMDELMDLLRVVNVKVYKSFMGKIRRL